MAQPNNGSSFCFQCVTLSDRYYADELGQAFCHTCPVNSHIRSGGGTSITECTCMKGYFRHDLALNGVECEACPPGANCEGSAQIQSISSGIYAINTPPVPLGGYWAKWYDEMASTLYFTCSPLWNCGAKESDEYGSWSCENKTGSSEPMCTTLCEIDPTTGKPLRDGNFCAECAEGCVVQETKIS